MLSYSYSNERMYFYMEISGKVTKADEKKELGKTNFRDIQIRFTYNDSGKKMSYSLQNCRAKYMNNKNGNLANIKVNSEDEALLVLYIFEFNNVMYDAVIANGAFVSDLCPLLSLLKLMLIF